MPSFLDHGPEGRRHTTAHETKPTTTSNTPATSRNNSVASNRSEPSTPSWQSAYNGVDTSKVRKDSVRPNLSPRNSSSKLTQKPGTDATSGWKALFGSNSEEKKEKKKQKQKEVDKIVLTSRHAAAVKTKMAVDPKFAEERRRSSASSDAAAEAMGAPISSAHLTAQQQEMRFPHSGPPSTHKGGRGVVKRKGRSGEQIEADMPALTKIVSGDSNDDEDESGQRAREDWIMKRNETAMRRFTLAEGMEDEAESRHSKSISDRGSLAGVDVSEATDGKPMTLGGQNLIGAELTGDAYTPRHKIKAGLGSGWKRGEDGHWKR